MKSYSLAEIAKWVGGVVRGDASTRISGIAGIEQAEKTEITWIAHDRYVAKLRSSRAGAVVVPERFGETPIPAVLCENPSLAMIIILEHFAPEVPRPAVGVHPTAQVAPSAKLGCDVAIGPQVVIENGAKIGDRTVLHAGVYIGADVAIGRDCEIWQQVVIRERCILGNQVIVHPNTTIGADGFGYQFSEGKHRKIPQIGTVHIEDEVEIGANCAIDRAKFGTTRIGTGTKIDNLVQVAHNVQIGPHCIIVAHCGIGGSVRLGRGVVLGGHVGIKDHVILHDGAQVAGCSCVGKDMPPGTKVMGIPAVDFDQFARERARVHRLPQMVEQLQALIKRVEQLESAANDT